MAPIATSSPVVASSLVAPSPATGAFESVDANVLNEKATPARETIIVFDWDDTLLSSSFLSSRGLRLDSETVRGTGSEIDLALAELEVSVNTVLTTALGYGSVYVVTNAETGWVQLSCAKFIPAVVPMLSKLSIISARSTFEAMFPDSPLKWKYHAFQEKLYPYYQVGHPAANMSKNVISFGDSHVEREAVRAVTRGLPSTLCKSVKFAERPSMEQLRRQIELVNNCFAYIHNHAGDLDLQLTVTVNNNTPVPAPKTVNGIDSGTQSSRNMMATASA